MSRVLKLGISSENNKDIKEVEFIEVLDTELGSSRESELTTRQVRAAVENADLVARTDNEFFDIQYKNVLFELYREIFVVV